MMTRRLKKSVALVAAAGLLVAACGGDDDDATPENTEQSDTGGATSDDGTQSAEDTSADSSADSSSEGTGVQAGDQASGDVDTDVTENTVPEGIDKYGGSISVGLEAEAVGLRPWEDTCSSPCYNIMVTIYDKLVEQDVDGEYQGFLADSFSSNDDFTVWTMNLRPGVMFHNGVELTAQTIADMFPIQQAGRDVVGPDRGVEPVQCRSDRSAGRSRTP